MVVLIDSGASHNFINSQVTTALGLDVNHTKKLGVRLGDGHRVETKRKCSSLVLNLGSIDVTMDAYVLDLGGVDVILGIVWLQSLGKVLMDWKEMTMIFQHGAQTVRLQGQVRTEGKKSKQQGPVAETATINSILEESTRESGEFCDHWIVYQLQHKTVIWMMGRGLN